MAQKSARMKSERNRTEKRRSRTRGRTSKKSREKEKSYAHDTREAWILFKVHESDQTRKGLNCSDRQAVVEIREGSCEVNEAPLMRSATPTSLFTQIFDAFFVSHESVCNAESHFSSSGGVHYRISHLPCAS